MSIQWWRDILDELCRRYHGCDEETIDAATLAFVRSWFPHRKKWKP